MRLGWLLALMIGFTGSKAIAQIVKVRVMDEARQPVVNATVFFAPTDSQGILLLPPQTQKTDEDGMVTLFLNTLWEASGWKARGIAVWSQKGEAESRRELVTPRLPPTNTIPVIILQLRPTFSLPLRFRLLNGKGKPVVGAWMGLAALRITGEMAGWLMTGQSDEQGFVRGLLRFRFPLTGLSEEKRFLLLVWHCKEGWAWRSCTLADLEGDVPLSFIPAQPVTMRFRNCFGEPVADIKGRLVCLTLPDFPSSIPLPLQPFTFISDKHGFLSVPLPAGATGDWEWHAETPSDITRRYQNRDGLLSLAPGTHWDIRFHDGGTQVTGKLLDAQTRQPLVNCPLLFEIHPDTIFSAAGTYWHRTVTDSKGQFRVAVGVPLKPAFTLYNCLALHLPDGQRYWLDLLKEAEHLPGCWRITLPPLPVKPPTGKIIAQAEMAIKEATFPEGVSEETRERLELEFQEMRKRALIFFVAIASQQNKEDGKTISVMAVNCEGKKRQLQLCRRYDGVGAVMVAPPRQHVVMPLGEGDWLVAAFVAFPTRPALQIPRGIHFFALISPLQLAHTRNALQIRLEPKAIKIASLIAHPYSNLQVFRPDALKPQ